MRGSLLPPRGVGAAGGARAGCREAAAGSASPEAVAAAAAAAAPSRLRLRAAARLARVIRAGGGRLVATPLAAAREAGSAGAADSEAAGAAGGPGGSSTGRAAERGATARALAEAGLAPPELCAGLVPSLSGGCRCTGNPTGERCDTARGQGLPPRRPMPCPRRMPRPWPACGLGGGDTRLAVAAGGGIEIPSVALAIPAAAGLIRLAAAARRRASPCSTTARSGRPVTLQRASAQPSEAAPAARAKALGLGIDC